MTSLEEKLAKAQRTVKTLEEELKETQQGVLALAVELEERVEKRTAELTAANAQLQREVAERTKAEEALRQLNLELEQRVQDRTAELESFTYSVSHDLRAPLRGIRGFGQALLDDLGGQLDEAHQTYLRQIGAGCQRMDTLIEALLNLSHLARAPLRRQNAHLSRLAHEIALELQATAPGRPVTWRIAENLTAEADLVLLRQVLTNLLANAFKFTAKVPHPIIEFGLQSDALPAPPSALPTPHSPVFFIRDNGAGFDLKYADKLFAPFQRLHSANEFPGTGVGLSTVQRIVHRHGGRIWVAAQPNRGATFFFTLPPAAPEEMRP